jgi:hypothetical protein
LGQDYAQYDWAREDKHHAGLDIAESVGTTVRAAAGGVIVKIQENDVGCDSTVAGSCEDHGFGNTVIIKHVIGSTVVYSQYSHMESIPTNLKTSCGAIDANRRHRRTCGTPVQIDAGISVGTVGCTRFGLSTCDSSFGSHLHFEVKDFGTLGSTGDDSGEFGYTTIQPDLNGYIDPLLNLHQLTSISDTQVRVTSFGQGINIRLGPGDYRTYQRTVAAGEEFVAIATAPATTTPACSDGWYLILATSLTQETRVVNEDLYFNDLSRAPSAIPDAWICKGNAGQVWAQSVAAPATLASPTPGSKLAGASVTFAWSAGTGVSQYWFYVGTSAGGNDLYGQSQGTNRSVTVSGLPTDGRNLYVRLWSQISGSWQFNDYTYTSAGIKLIVFPIPNRTYSSVSINSVFDHSMNKAYCSDNVVVAYTGEEGRSIYGSSLVGNINT